MSTTFTRPASSARRSSARPTRKVTVVEYASMSCPHCAHFDATTFDAFKLKYVDSGKVRYIFREFPLNAPAYAVAMVARCAPADHFFDVIHTYFRSQDKWLRRSDVKAAILDIAKDSDLPSKALMRASRIRHYSRRSNEVRDARRRIWRAGHADLLHQRQEVRRGAVA